MSRIKHKHNSLTVPPSAILLAVLFLVGIYILPIHVKSGLIIIGVATLIFLFNCYITLSTSYKCMSYEEKQAGDLQNILDSINYNTSNNKYNNED